MNKPIEPSTRTTERAVGLAIYGTAVSGVLALFLALLGAFSGRWQEAGICLVAAAIAFGLLTNALLRS
jgi:high-affinity Fe2+/Pb2+ permease